MAFKSILFFFFCSVFWILNSYFARIIIWKNKKKVSMIIIIKGSQPKTNLQIKSNRRIFSILYFFLSFASRQTKQKWKNIFIFTFISPSNILRQMYILATLYNTWWSSTTSIKNFVGYKYLPFSVVWCGWWWWWW